MFKLVLVDDEYYAKKIRDANSYMTPSEFWAKEREMKERSLALRNRRVNNIQKMIDDFTFFIDLVERKRNARLTEPPYIPEREGYVFEGWYKEEECINAWDFETDFVEIKAEKGKQIYEEIRLYAKWAPVS